jgi:ABC-type lipoprotein release transport system permease subunit
MTSVQLVRRGLSHYWRTNLAVIAGVAAAVTVLSGALLVGDSVRGSLRALVEGRLGATDLAVVSSEFFRAALADDIAADPSFAREFKSVAPLVAVQGAATEQAGGRRASRVFVYGIDERFWQFHGVTDPAALGLASAGSSRDVLLSPALARELEAGVDSTVLLRLQKPAAIPIESLHGRKDEVGQTVRLTVRGIAPAASLGEFSLQPQQGDVRAAFVPLARLQQDLGLAGRVNTLLVSSQPAADHSRARGHFENLVRRHATPEDLGLKLRVLTAQGALALESDSALIDKPREDAAAAAARQAGMTALPVLTYLANTMRAGDRMIPYSLVTAYELSVIAPDAQAEETSQPPVVLNEWAARELNVRAGDRVRMDYYVWEDPGRLAERNETFLVAGILPIAGAAADRDLSPTYPGITESENIRDWDPPFPIDLELVRPVDEQYWRTYRTTPKAFVPEAVGRALWQSRYGSATSLRILPPTQMPLEAARDRFEAALRSALDPIAMGLMVRDVRADGLAASRGATDFGEYFSYFSFFLVVSAMMLAALFFKLGIEQRAREVGLLRAVGFTAAAVRRLFIAEGAALALAGSAIGLLGALGYGALMMAGLRTWWVDAVGTTALTLHVSVPSLIAGAIGGIVAALACIWWTLRVLTRVTERSLLAGQIDIAAPTASTPSRTVTMPLAVALGGIAIAALLLTLSGLEWIGRSAAFFGAAAFLLLASLSAALYWLRKPPRQALAGRGWLAVSRLGLRNATYRPGRSVLAMAVVASATFILIAVDAFRRDGAGATADPRSGTGGYALLVETAVPLARDPNSPDGRELLGLSSTDGVAVTPLRMLPGDDASCLNLYEPRQPKIVGVPRSFIDDGRFVFQSSLDRNDEERANPWLLLRRQHDDGAVPVIADANSMTYVLHKGLGDDIVINRNGAFITLRLVAALQDSVLQGELLMSDENFLRLFPDQEGYRYLLVSAPGDRAGEVAAALEDRLSDFGADAVPAGERLAEFHRVENTYLSTFQTLGGLGLLLGTIGLAAVLLRNVLERRRELALLGAVGYGRGSLFAIVIAESALLLTAGLLIGVVCALIAVAPAAAERGGRLPTGAGSWLLLFAVFATGLVASIVATRAAIQSRLLDALRAE